MDHYSDNFLDYRGRKIANTRASCFLFASEKKRNFREISFTSWVGGCVCIKKIYHTPTHTCPDPHSHPHPQTPTHPSFLNSRVPGTESRQYCPEFPGFSTNSGIGRSSQSFGISTISQEFPGNSVSTQFSEFLSGITYSSQRLIFHHNTEREGEDERQFRYGILELERVPGILRIDGTRSMSLGPLLQHYD